MGTLTASSLSSQRLCFISPPAFSLTKKKKKWQQNATLQQKYLRGKTVQTIFNFCPFSVPFILLHMGSVKCWFSLACKELGPPKYSLSWEKLHKMTDYLITIDKLISETLTSHEAFPLPKGVFLKDSKDEIKGEMGKYIWSDWRWLLNTFEM